MKYKYEYGKELEGILINISKDRKLLREFLQDLLSPSEYKDLAVRWQIIRQLDSKNSQRDIVKNLKVSIATVTRGSRELLNKTGGFRLVLDKYYKRK